MHCLGVTPVPREDLSLPHEVMQTPPGSFSCSAVPPEPSLTCSSCTPRAAVVALQYTQCLAEPLFFLFMGSVSESGRLVMYRYLLVGDL